MHCRHLVAHVVWEYRRLPYRLWVWRRRLMIRVAKWRLRKFDECPQCAFNAGPRWVGFPE